LDDDLIRASSRSLGRDPTLHGRNEIWSRVLREDTNPFIGVGFYSFWTPDRNRRLSTGFYYSLGTAHNGYIETYVNHGLIGLALLLVMLVWAMQKARRAVLEATPLGALRLTLLIVLLLNNITESSFDRLVPAWLTLLLVAFDPPIRRSALSRRPPPFAQPALQLRPAA
jgi:O-antigen ligase